MPEKSANSDERIRDLQDEVRSLEREDAVERAATSEAVADRIDQVAGTVVGVTQSVNSKYETVVEQIRARPLAAIFSAAAVGFIFGRALR
jgi:hypothetical protein